MTTPQPSHYIPRYSAESIDYIVQSALACRKTVEYSPARLHQLARELNIPAEHLHIIEEDWLATPPHSAAQPDPVQPSTPAIDHQSWLNYCLVNAGLVTLNLIIVGSLSWAIYPIVGWGLALVLHPTLSSSKS
ncbi:2TM domain-containing protein [Spirulina major CS-329]|uniref:2TM domain-containing protein n=1 Tax=Spirulina TaxID=1154 RepID=UPI00232B73F1|nr:MULTISPECIES: 2TM domain-containing protein [Spirulina]MDB9496744.1 2TM domain-containing protein [Spirulina subsalsa CS-330]MDB9505043.1 2TM domain-containing protein [Spirulina major CS-329]